jgi:hypothetical protein
MATRLAGYGWLIEKFDLRVRPQSVAAVIDTAEKTRVADRHARTQTLRFPPAYRPDDSLRAHLQFALRYEGVNLEVLSALFEKTGHHEFETWLRESPESAYARRVAFLFEWITDTSPIDASAAPISRYLAAVDTKLQFGMLEGARNAKFRIIDNLPGVQAFCPMVRRDPDIEGMIAKDLAKRARDVLSRYDPDLVRRAAEYLYLAETHSSFEIERERPSPTKAQRFSALLREADSAVPLTEERLLDLQHSVVDAHVPEVSYRTTQNWVGRDTGMRRVVSFVPPRPEHVRSLMDGLIAMHERWKAKPSLLDPVIHAAMVSFGFVFIHPFLDGNGRLHRYLIHETLAACGFTPRGLIFPVSAAILASKADYMAILEDFSQRAMALTRFVPPPADVSAKTAQASGNDRFLYQYFDATEQALYLYHAIERTIDHDLQTEIDYLLAFDRAHREIDAIADFPGQALDLLINLVVQNGGVLSKNKRESHFSYLADDVVGRYEKIIRDAFKLNKKQR